MINKSSFLKYSFIFGKNKSNSFIALAYPSMSLLCPYLESKSFKLAKHNPLKSKANTFNIFKIPLII